jgi:general secretion pathway protein G
MKLISTYRPWRARRNTGFTLLELIIVIAVLGILASIAVINLKNSPTRAKEAVLKTNLRSIREVLDQFYADQGAYPASLEDLVSEGYFRGVPIDPITGESDWQIIFEGDLDGDPDQFYDDSFDDWGDEPGDFGQTSPGILDVHSNAPGNSLRGEVYAEW